MVHRKKVLFAFLAVALFGSVAWMQQSQELPPLAHNPYLPRIQVEDGDGLIWEAVLNAHAVTAYFFAPKEGVHESQSLDSIIYDLFPDKAAEALGDPNKLLYDLRTEFVYMVATEFPRTEEWLAVHPDELERFLEDYGLDDSAVVRVPIAHQLYLVDGHNPDGLEGCIKLSDCRLICDPT